MVIRTYGRSRYVIGHFTSIFNNFICIYKLLDIDCPIQVSSSTGPKSGPEPSPGQIAMLADMSFTSAHWQATESPSRTVREFS